MLSFDDPARFKQHHYTVKAIVVPSEELLDHKEGRLSPYEVENSSAKNKEPEPEFVGDPQSSTRMGKEPNDVHHHIISPHLNITS